MSLLKARVNLLPYEYPEFIDIWNKQQSVHWTHLEIPIQDSIHDFKYNLTSNEKHLVENVLREFSQTEVLSSEYWGTKVSRWFKIPEICLMASAFSNMEGVHIQSYSLIDTSLNLTESVSFLKDSSAKAKIDRLIDCPGETLEEIALSLAIFSAFTEGVSLYSNFSIILGLTRRNLLKSIGKIIFYSIRDENLHSESGILLFKTLIREQPQLWTKEFKRKLYDSARITVELEDAFIDKAFESGPVEDLDPKTIKNYIRHRANSKLLELGLKTNWKNIDKEKLEEMSWFNTMASGSSSTDFFSQRENLYSKNVVILDSIWQPYDKKREDI